MGLPSFGSGKRTRLALWTVASLALTAVPQVRAAEPDNATLLQEIRALKEVVHDLVQTVRELEHRVSVLEGRAPATASAPPAKPPDARAAPPAVPAANAVPTVTPGTHQAAMPVPQAAPAEPQVATAPLAAPAGTGGPYVSPEALLRANWSKIRADMDESEVTNLLGPPSKKFTLGARTVWYYYYPATGRGSVFFTDAGRVTSLQSPFGWWDW